jgi:threonine/homoserine/homoserine lactone efflux protein
MGCRHRPILFANWRETVFFYFFYGLSLGGPAAATPGPFQAFLLSQTLKNGWKRTLPASLAPLLSDGPIIALVLLVLTQTPDWFLTLLRIGGGCFLIYLAKEAYAVSKRSPADTPVLGESSQRGLLKAVIMNGLNPNPYIYWGLVGGPILLEAWRQAPSLGVSFLVGFYGTLVGGIAAFIVLFAMAGRLGGGVTRSLSLVSAVLLFSFGLYQLWSTITASFN